MRMSAPSNQIEPTRWFRVVLKERVWGLPFEGGHYLGGRGRFRH